jgi:ABC-type antimicrobial peptide transport system permease subunit
MLIGRNLNSGERGELRSRLNAAFVQAGLRLKILSIRTTNQERAWLAQKQIDQARILGAIALFAWAVALSGVFVQLRLFLAMRRHLAAIYAALGAGPCHLYGSVMATALAMSLTGIILSLLFIPWVARQFAFLSGATVSPYAASTWIALVLLLLAVGAVVHGPARRAACADPAESLHEL